MKCFPALLALLFFASTANCETPLPPKQTLSPYKTKPFALSVGGGVMDGDTTYRIGGHWASPSGDRHIRFPLSELVFPLDLYFGRIGGELNLMGRFRMTASVSKNITDHAGNMKDSDWGVNIHAPAHPGWDDPNSLDIYSESRTDADIIVADVSARYHLHEAASKKWAISLFAGARYIYREFDFVARDVQQWYPSMEDYYGYSAGHLHVSGTALTYNVTQEIPAAIAGIELVGDSGSTLDLEFGYAPETEVKDEDHHLLRDKVSYGTCEGTAFLFSLTGSCRFHAGWSLDLKYDYVWLETEGSQRQYDGALYMGTIDQTISSETQTFEMALSLLF